MKTRFLKVSLAVAAAVFLAGCEVGGEGGLTINVNQPGTGGGGGGGGGGLRSCSDLGTLPGFASCTDTANGSQVTISGTIDQDFTIDPTDADQFVFDGEVKVGAGDQTVDARSTGAVDSKVAISAIRAAGVDLTVLPGADVRFTGDGTLLVTRGSRLIADGTAQNPITFSSVDNNFDGLGEWGGIVLQGFAPQFGPGNTGACDGGSGFCNVAGEGTGTLYGGDDPADDSGILRYVRIAEGGLVAGPNNEVNGLTLQGVGYGTTIEYVHVHNNLDDGIEWFGGTVNARYLVLTNNDDDSIDYDEGYQGNIQYAIVQMNPNKATPTGSNDPRGIEANSSDNDYVPQTNAALANVLIIGAPINDGQRGMRLRGALTTTIYNSAIRDFDSGCIRIDDADLGTSVVESNVTLVNILNNCVGGIYTNEVADSETNVINSNVTVSPSFALDDSAASLSAAPTMTVVNNGSNFAFEPTAYIGAVAPGTNAAQAWWANWTLPGVLTPPAESPAPASFVSCNAAQTQCTVTGNIDTDYIFTAGTDWFLSGEVLVGGGNVTVNNDTDVQNVIDNGVTLTIRPGVNVFGLSDGVLFVTRGSRLVADGTAAAPITFSSPDAGFEGEGEWGGIIVQGFAPQFGAGNTGACFGAGTTCNIAGEGGGKLYGGNLPADNSGIIRYVRIAEGGLVQGPNNEVNGLTLQGVGHGTTLEYVQVHSNLDDGVEWFGGTVNAKYLVLTSNDDDSIDYDEGYQGNIQYAIVQMNPNKAAPTGSNDPRGIEANSSDTDYVPQTNATLANVLIVGAPVNDGQRGMRLRGALQTAIYNSAVRDFSSGCIRIDDANLGTSVVESNVTLVNILNNCVGGIYTNQVADSETNVVSSAVTVDAAYAIQDTAAQLASAPTITPVNNGSGFTFDQTNYVGAVAPGTSAANAWWASWTLPGTVNPPQEAPEPAPFVSCNADQSECTVSGTIDRDYVFTAGTDWFLSGEVLVGGGNVTVNNDTDVQNVIDSGVALTIRPGVNVFGLPDGVLFITRGSQLIADGTAASPITFSSPDAGFEGEGEWGGIIVQGFAPQFGPGNTGACFGTGTTCNIAGEGGGKLYGGNLPADNSGIIRYVRIAEGGLVQGPNNEVNGLTLQGVGHGTTLEYVQVHSNLDDGVEWFGGTVNAKYLILTSNDDDSIDYDEGYQGNIQYAIVQMNPNKASPTGSNDPRGIEANSSDTDYVPQTNATLANVLIVGAQVNDGQRGMRLRGALQTAIYNSAVRDFSSGCIRIDDANLGTSVVESNVTLVNILNNCAGGIYTNQTADTETNVVNSSVTIDSAYALLDSSARLASAPTITAVNNGSGFTFDQTNYVGAVAPGTSAANAWWADWALPGTVTPPQETPQPASFVSCNAAQTECTVSGNIDTDYVFTAGTTWFLSGEVLVGGGNVTVNSAADITAVRNAGVTLTIRPGVNVQGLGDGVLFITRGSRLIADGTRTQPITFSSPDADFDGEGEWGGVIVQGFAPQFGAGNTGACFGTGTTCNIAGEGGGKLYGGNDPADNSGIIRYVRIAEGGLVNGPNNEVNGLTLQGVGHGTIIEYVQVHNNLDDGVEWFGGTVNAKYLVLTNNDDDSIDYDEGYQGNIQYAIVRMNPVKAAPTGSNDPRGIEANSSDTDYVPQTNATLSNVLILGATVNNGQRGMRLRGALQTAIYNSAVRDFSSGCIRIDDANLGTSVVASDVTLVNILNNCAGGIYTNEVADSETNVVASTVTVDAAYALTDTAATVAPPTITPVANGSGFVFDSTGYVGAVAPGTSASAAWWNGWVIPGSLP